MDTLIFIGRIIFGGFFIYSWEIKNPQSRTADKANFMKNIALLGAIFMLLAIPTPWPLSFVP